MIDRSKPLFFLRPTTLAAAAGISLGLYAIIPAIALMLFIAALVVATALYGAVVISGVLAAFGLVGGIATMFKEGKKYKALGVGMILLGIIFGMICVAAKDALPGVASAVFESLNDRGAYLLDRDDFGAAVERWSFAPLVLAVFLAGASLVLIRVLRLQRTLEYAISRIGYRCQDCGKSNFDQRCPACHRLVSDLEPSIHGVFSARCTCGCRLPTTYLTGRLWLEKVCADPKCQARLEDPSLVQDGEHCLAIVGAPGSGKSSLMLTALGALAQDFAPSNGLIFDLPDQNEQRTFRSLIERLRQGEALDRPGAPELPSEFHVSLQPNDRTHGSSSRLYIYDAYAKEIDDDDLTPETFHRFADGVILVIDPTAEPAMRRAMARKRGQKGQNAPNESIASTLIRLVISLWEARLGTHAGSPFTFPIAVVLTKVDMVDLGLPRDQTGAHDTMRTAARHAAGYSKHVRRFLAKHGMNDALALLESRCSRVAYFGVSALGRKPDGADTRPYASRGVLAPLLWLAHETGALADEQAWPRFIRNLRDAGEPPRPNEAGARPAS